LHDRCDHRTVSIHLVEGPLPGNPNDLPHGTVDLLVLNALAWEPMHGYALVRWIEQRTNGELEMADSALYKALARLEDSGAIAAEWGASANNRRAKYYSLTPRGRQLLRAEIATWKRYVAAVTGVIETA
jgi:transcriptional regulator